jgi:hypothetical protein
VIALWTTDPFSRKRRRLRKKKKVIVRRRKKSKLKSGRGSRRVARYPDELVDWLSAARTPSPTPAEVSFWTEPEAVEIWTVETVQGGGTFAVGSWYQRNGEGHQTKRNQCVRSELQTDCFKYDSAIDCNCELATAPRTELWLRTVRGVTNSV